MWPVTAPPAAPSAAPRATARPRDLALLSSSCTNASFVSLATIACRASLGRDGSETLPAQAWLLLAVRLRRLVADLADFAQQITQRHSRQCLEQRWNLRGHLRDVPGYFVETGGAAVAG